MLSPTQSLQPKTSSKSVRKIWARKNKEKKKEGKEKEEKRREE